jgi:hypothetical protein
MAIGRERVWYSWSLEFLQSSIDRRFLACRILARESNVKCENEKCLRLLKSLFLMSVCRTLSRSTIVSWVSCHKSCIVSLLPIIGINRPQ